MNLDEAIRTRINELVKKETSLTNLCLKSNITPSTIFDFMYGKIKAPTIITIKKICAGANITLQEFFDRNYFNDFDEVYK
ncbi:MAG: transcriptional regulator [Clostridia bacterium]|nr:transcriptional regulator [Clostridia bacterium]